MKTGTQAAKVYFIFTDQQGSVPNMRQRDGTWVNNSTVRYDAFGGYRSKPADTVNRGLATAGLPGIDTTTQVLQTRISWARST